MLLLTVPPTRAGDEWIAFDITGVTGQSERESILVGATRVTRFVLSASDGGNAALAALEARLPGDFRRCQYGVAGWEHYRVEAHGIIGPVYRRQQVWASPDRRHAVVVTLLTETMPCSHAACGGTGAKLDGSLVENRARHFWQDFARVCPAWQVESPA